MACGVPLRFHESLTLFPTFSGAMMLDPRLKYLSHKQVRENSWDLVLLPFGATEPHNLHLPYGTDIFQVEEIGRRGCVKANEKGAKALLLPAIPFGVNTNYYQIPGGLTPGLKPTTLLAIIKDVATALSRQGIRKLVLLNGHGGNELKPFLRELFDELPIFIGLIDWYRMAGDLCKATLSEPGEHADELETSLMLALRPELVNMTVADDGTPIPAKVGSVNKGWLTVSRPWHLATTGTGIGCPHKGTAEKGHLLLESSSDRLAEVILELAQVPYAPGFPW